MFFSACKQAVLAQLQQAVASGQATSINDACAKLTTHLANMSAEWNSGTTPQIAYHDPYCRAAYLYAHVPANANLCLRALRDLDAVWPLPTGDDEYKIVAFGGGPGTELLAFAKFMRERRMSKRNTRDFSVAVLDHVTEWSESLGALATEIKADYKSKFGAKKDWPAVFDTHSFTFNFTQIDNFANVPSLFDASMVVLNFVISEIGGENFDQLAALLEDVHNKAPSGTIFLFIDRNQYDVKMKAEQAAKRLGGEIHGPVVSQTNMDASEQAATMAGLLKMVARSPRTQWNAFWVAVRKP